VSTSEVICSIASRISGRTVDDPSLNLQTDLPIESIQVAEILIAVEDHFAIELAESELAGVGSIVALAALVDAKRSL